MEKTKKENLPAHAGVILHALPRVQTGKEPTRTRGGDPHAKYIVDTLNGTYPHTRG